MSDQHLNDGNRSNLPQTTILKSRNSVGADTNSPAHKADETHEKVIDVSQLSAEEQMALYEEELKNEDWGHQPC